MTSARILIVDDDGEMLSMLKRHVEGEGYTVTAAKGGREALAAIEGAT